MELKLDSPRRGNWAEEKLYLFIVQRSEFAGHGFPPKGQLGGRTTAVFNMSFLKMDSPQRGNWAEEEFFKKYDL